jgi:hypothetical protein
MEKGIEEFPGGRHSGCRVDNLVVVGLKNVQNILGIAGDIPGPSTEAAVSAHSFDPFRQEFALGFVLLGVLAFGAAGRGESCGWVDGGRGVA